MPCSLMFATAAGALLATIVGAGCSPVHSQLRGCVCRPVEPITAGPTVETSGKPGESAARAASFGESTPSPDNPGFGDCPPEFVPCGPDRWLLLADRLDETKCDLWLDHQNFYSWPTMSKMLVAVGGAGVLANTSLDQDLHDWYQDDLRSPESDHVADVVRVFGEGQIIIPTCIGLGLLGSWCDDTLCGHTVGEFGLRSSRALLVGSPPLLALQNGLGASRPGETARGSDWKPFDDDNSASGHAFIGAVPFITAAQMTENPWLRGGLYFCSTWAAWSRVNDDDHYLSQAMLGWWLAYLSCTAVSRTETSDTFEIVPVSNRDLTGLALVLKR